MKMLLSVHAAVVFALWCAGVCGACEPSSNLETMDQKALLSRARLLTQEELEISRRAMQQAASGEVRAFAKRAAARSEELDKNLTDIGKTAGVEEPEPGSKPLFERLNAIEKVQGEAFDPDYLKLMLDFHGDYTVIYERLLKIGTTEALRDFARASLAEERTHLKIVQKLAAPLIPEAEPAEK
jgi:putative membrane protein